MQEFPKQETKELTPFQQKIKIAMGDNIDAKLINFSELDEDGQDSELYEQLNAGTLTAEKINKATYDADAAGHTSSAKYRGWLANQLNIILLLREMQERKNKK